MNKNRILETLDYFHTSIPEFREFHVHVFSEHISTRLYCGQLVFLQRRRSYLIVSPKGCQSLVVVILASTLVISIRTTKCSCYLGCKPGMWIRIQKLSDPGKSASQLERAITMVCQSHIWIASSVRGSLTGRKLGRSCAWVCDHSLSVCLPIPSNARNCLTSRSCLRLRIVTGF